MPRAVAPSRGKNSVSRCRYLLVVVVTIALVALATPATATQDIGFTIVSQSAHYDAQKASVTFTVVFNEDPNFLATDLYGRQQDSFQYFIVGDASLHYPANYDSIIRGAEIHVTRTSIRIRNAYPPDGSDPDSGGWGTSRGTAVFALHGRVLRFSTPLRLISDHPDQETIPYQLESYRFGAFCSLVQWSIRL
jgi:hypothetical protein